MAVPSPAGDEADTDTDAAAAWVAVRVSARLAAVTDGMREALGATIAELVGDDSLLETLGAAIEANVTTVLRMLREHTLLSEVDVPAAAIAHARRLAQQGVPVFAMLRAYRLGHAYLLEECYRELPAICPEPALSLRAYKAINVRTLSYVDWVSQEVVTAYEIERDQWVRTRDTVRTARVQEIVAGRDDGLGAEAVLRYPLRQHHVAAVFWSEEDMTTGSLSRLEAAAAAVGGVLATSDPLVVATDRSSTWAWFPRGEDDTEPDLTAVENAMRAADVAEVRVAVGGTGVGVDGFRDSHRQAVLAGDVLAVGGHPTRRLVGYREPGVAVASLLVGELDRVRVLVRDALGPLAADDADAARLRAALRSLVARDTIDATSAPDENSVTSRVERALELRGRPLGDDRLDVELALVACRWLPGVLE